MNRKFEIDQTVLEQWHGTAGVNGPERAFALQLRNQIHAAHIEDRIGIMRDERPVEVGAEETDLSGHEAGNLVRADEVAMWPRPCGTLRCVCQWNPLPISSFANRAFYGDRAPSLQRKRRHTSEAGAHNGTFHRNEATVALRVAAAKLWR